MINGKKKKEKETWLKNMIIIYHGAGAGATGNADCELVLGSGSL